MTERARRASKPAATARWALLGALSCAGHGDALARGQGYYEDNQYERALSLWRDLDRRQAAFAPTERVRYAYFRGMTDYRLGYRADARHWLAIAKAGDADGSPELGAAWRERLDGALVDLERETFGIRPDGSDVIQTIELPPGATASDGAALDAGASPSKALPGPR